MISENTVSQTMRLTCGIVRVPDWVVSAHYTNIFKNRLNHYWQHQDLQHIVYDFQAHIQGMETEVNFV